METTTTTPVFQISDALRTKRQRVEELQKELEYAEKDARIQEQREAHDLVRNTEWHRAFTNAMKESLTAVNALHVLVKLKMPSPATTTHDGWKDIRRDMINEFERMKCMMYQAFDDASESSF